MKIIHQMNKSLSSTANITGFQQNETITSKTLRIALELYFASEMGTAGTTLFPVSWTDDPKEFRPNNDDKGDNETDQLRYDV